MAIIDLTQELSNDMPLYPGLPRPRFEDIARVGDDGYAMSRWQFVNHVGTHVDAPAHQVDGGDTLDQIALHRLVTPAVVLDFSARERPGPLSVDDLGEVLGEVRDGDLVLVRSDNGHNWGADAYWTGWSYPDAGAARALIDAGASAIGFDGPSADPVDTTTFDLHKVWLSAGRLIVENLCNLDLLPRRTRVVIAPLRVRGANGSPARVFALGD